MRVLQFAAVVAIAASYEIIDEDYKTKICRPELIDEINAKATTWKAGVTTRFANATVADVKKLLGTILPRSKEYIAPELTRSEFKYSAADVPASFDVRTNWPGCTSITGKVRDQSSCGSCWAFGSTEAFNDRYCIKTGNAVPYLAVEDTTACCTGAQCSFSNGCNGGQPSGAWNWFVKTGVSTGGDYSDIGTGTTCKPYTLQSCAHHTTPPPGMVSCDTLPEYPTPQCTSSCSEKAYPTAYSKDKYHAASSYSIKAANMQQEIMERGTISVSMSVYEDFETYTSGIYQHVTGSYLGGHAIKMVGWGVENGTPYWICVNSWNESWGEAGSCRILRGTDECGIEDGAVAGDV